MKLFFSIRLFTCTNEESTDEDTFDEDDDKAQLLDEMSQTLENLLQQNKTINSSNTIEVRKVNFMTFQRITFIFFSVQKCYILSVVTLIITVNLIKKKNLFVIMIQLYKHIRKFDKQKLTNLCKNI